MKITIVQTDIAWEDKAYNLRHLDSLIKPQTIVPDLYILPEMFSTGFSPDIEKLAEEMDSGTVQWMIGLAAVTGSSICGTLIIKENNRYFNRFVLVNGTGVLHTYDKRHIFTIGGENNRLNRGGARKTFNLGEFSINPVICYDLRFPVWIRNRNDFDLLICPANWPESRSDVWKTLLKARALENQCYVAGVNRIGKDASGASYSGDSVIFDPKGREIATVSPHTEGLATAVLSIQELRAFRKKFPAWKDADDFIIKDQDGSVIH